MSYEGLGIASSDHDHDHDPRPAASQPHATVLTVSPVIPLSSLPRLRTSEAPIKGQNQMATSNNLQPPRPPRFRLHLHPPPRPPSPCRFSTVVDVPSASALLTGNENIIILVSNSSSIRMEARTGAVDVRAEQRLEQ